MESCGCHFLSDLLHKVRTRIARALYILLPLVLLITFISAPSSALSDLGLFGPKKFVRLSGKPTVYTESFQGCMPSGKAVLRVTNGSNKDTRITSAEIKINGKNVVVEKDFKKQTAFIEKSVLLKQNNSLTLKLKSGHSDNNRSDKRDDGKEKEGTSTDKSGQRGKQEQEHDKQGFLIIEIVGQNCGSSDSIPPTLSNPQPADGALLASAIPRIAASYADEPGGSGIDISTVRLAIDGKDVTSSAMVAPGGINYTPSNLSDGAHTAAVNVSDLAKNPASLTWHFTTDTLPPVVHITSNQNNQYVNTPSITVTGTLDDLTATVAVNGRTAQVSGNTFTYAGLPLTEGSNSIVVEAKDPAGNIGKESILINLDTIAPVILVTTPARDSFVNTPVITVFGSVKENNPAGVWINSIPAELVNGVFSLPISPLSEGPNIVTVRSTDRAGNESTVTVPLVLDTILPVVTISEPLAGAYVNTPQITLNGAVSEEPVLVIVNGVNATVTGKDFTLAGITLLEGVNAVVVTATDRAGNISAPASVTVVLDTTAPVTTAAPIGGLYPTAQSVTLTANETATIHYTLDGTAPTAISSIYQNPISIENTTTLKYFSMDQAGNSETANEAVYTIDIQPPVLTLTTPTDGGYINNAALILSGTVSDNVGVREVTVNGASITISEGGTFSQTVTLATGANKLTVVAVDTAGNIATDIRTITLDQTAPSITVTAPIDNSLTNIVDMTLDGTVDEIATINVKINNGVPESVTVVNNAFSLPLTFIYGQNAIEVTATDLAGNSSTTRRTVILDNVGPSVAIITPAQDMATNQASMVLQGTVADLTSTVVSIALDGTVFTPIVVDGAFQQPLVFTTEKIYSIIATATDGAGNTTTLERNISYDALPPTGSLAINNGAAYTNSTEVALSLGCSDAISGCARMQFSNDNATWSDTEDYVSSKTWQLLPGNGQKTVYVRFIDSAGNASNATSASITLDATAPAVTITSPAAGTTTNNTPTLIYAVSDGTVVVKVDNVVVAKVSGNTLGPLADGQHTVRVQAMDSAGNTGFSEVAFTVDTSHATTVSGLISVNTTWTLAKSPYLVSGDVWVYGTATTAATLTIEPGVVVKFAPGTGLTIGNGGLGGLMATGTADAPILFTSGKSTPAPGNWNGIIFYDAVLAKTALEYVTVEYGGSGGYNTNANLLVYYIAPTIRNCIIRKSAGSGIYLGYSTSSPIILDSEFTGNKWGIYASSSTPFISNSRFVGNTLAGIWNETPPLDVDARNNWWGIASGPTYAGNTPGRGDKINEHVLYNPWLGQAMSGGALSIAEARVLPEAVNPNGGYVNFTAQVSAAANWAITIKDKSSNTVRTFTGTSAAISQKWYGDNSQSTKVVDGTYYYSFNAVDPVSGAAAIASLGLVTVSRALPISNMDPPVDNQMFPGGATINITGTASDPTGFNYYTLEYGAGASPLSWIALKTATTPVTNSLVQAWNTTALTGGLYALRLTTYNNAGKALVDTVRVRLLRILNVLASSSHISPNGDQIKDTTSLSATFTQESAWTITITNASGATVRTYTGTGTTLNQAWDGMNDSGGLVSDGTYTYRIDALSPETAVQAVQKTGTITVDTINPVAQIASPVPGEALWNTVQIIGTAADANIASYKLEYGPSTGAGPWTSIATGASSVNSGTIVAWNTNDPAKATIPNGNYLLRLTVTDKAGNSSVASVAVTISNLQLSNVGISANTINTLTSESSTIFFTINSPALVTLRIIAEKSGPTGEPIYQMSKNCDVAGAYSFTWDGRDNSGKTVPDEAYLYILEASDSVKTESYSPSAATGTGTVTCSQSSDFDPEKNLPMTVTYSPTRPSRVNISISWGSQNFNILTAFAATPGNHDYTWDVRNPSGKLLDIGAQSSCSVVSLLRENYIITTGDTPVVSALETDPYAVSLSYGQFTRIQYTLSRASIVTIQLVSPSGAAITLMNNQLQSAGPQELEWTGMDVTDSSGKKTLVTEEGDYMVSVKAINPATGTSSTTRANVRLGY